MGRSSDDLSAIGAPGTTAPDAEANDAKEATTAVPNSRTTGTGTSGLTDNLLWKLDRHLLVPMFFLNFFSLMGRTNIGATLIQRLPQDLGLDATKVFLVLTMPTVPLILSEIPSNLLMRWLDRKVGLGYVRYLCCMNICLGLVTLGQAFTKTWQEIFVTRFLVGIFDAGLIPGCIFVTSLWYPGKHIQWRLSILMLGNISSNIAGNFLAYAIAQIHAGNHWHGWRWIFIVEGCLTTSCALLCSLSSVGRPEKAHFLTADEKRVIADNVEAHKTDIGIVAEWKLFFRNPLNYVWAALYVFTCTTTYAVGVFSPTFVQAFHPRWSVPDVQAQVVPMFVVSSVACLGTSILADRLDHRSGFALLGYAFTIVGFSILRYDLLDAKDVTVMALYFIAIGTFISLPMVWNLTLLNLATPLQRAIGVGFVIGVGNSSSYIAAWVFRASQAPYYRHGIAVGLSLTCAAAGLLIATCLWVRFHNARLDRLALTAESSLRPKGTVLRYRI